MGDTTTHEPHFRIHIDRHPYIVHKHDLTGAELRNVPNPPIGEGFDLWLEEHGNVEDQLVDPAKTLRVKQDMHFYSSPSNINPGRC